MRPRTPASIGPTPSCRACTARSPARPKPTCANRPSQVGHPRPNFVRGVGITLTLDESQFTGSGVFLFGMVLDHFFGQYCSMNSFTQLTLRTQQREKRVVQWPARTGDQPLV